jgi:spore germination cell wall hydrolase CwlJ-like protein
MNLLKTFVVAAALITASSEAYATSEIEGFENQQRSCMLEALLFEAGNQPIIGKLAVAIVIINRKNHIEYPNTICGVVHEGPVNSWWYNTHNRIVPVKHKCQFSYWCDGKPDNIDEFVGTNPYHESIEIIDYLFTNNIPKLLEGATHYHADYVSPKWANVLKKVTTIGNHVFYK